MSSTISRRGHEITCRPAQNCTSATAANLTLVDVVGPHVVLHLAAQVDVRVPVERPDHDADVNVLGTVRILEAARRHGAQVVFASSGGAGYGECDGPKSESTPLGPLAPYGTSKICGEKYLATYNRLYGSVLDLTLVRRELGWHPEVSVATGVTTTWAWMSASADE